METGLKTSDYQGVLHVYINYWRNPHQFYTLSQNYGTYILPDGTIIGVGVGGGNEYGLSCTVPTGEKFDSDWIKEHQVRHSSSPCFGFIDINGPNGPNKEVACSNGVETTTEVEEPCVVKTKDITDIFPIAFHDATVEPASNAAMYVLRSAK